MVPQQENQEQRIEKRRAGAAGLLGALDDIREQRAAALSAGEYALSAAELGFVQSLHPIVGELTRLIDEQLRAETEPIPIAERCLTGFSKNKMQAWAMVLPAAFGGAPLSADGVRSALVQAGIVCGIEDAALEQMLTPEGRGKVFVVARGKPVVDGVDGHIIEHFEREKKATLARSENERVDYKNLHLFQQVHKGEKICTIVPATSGTEGLTVTGEAIAPQQGKPPFVPIGKNTELNETQTELRAKCDGQVCYSGQAFHVEQFMSIKGNVDSTTGNLDVIGNLEITGSVLEGFAVRATGDISVKGTVEGGTLSAGRDIRIHTGIKGSPGSSVTARGDIRCKYIENGEVHAGGLVAAETILNSQIFSNGRVEVIGGRGVILGGSIAAREAICAKTIGNESRRKTMLSVGGDPDFCRKDAELAENMRKNQHEIEETEKNVNYLESKRETLDERYRQLLSNLKLRLTVAKVQRIKMEKDYQKLRGEQNPEGSFIEASQLYPPVKVTIGCQIRQIDEEQHMCRIYLTDGEIYIGSK